MAISTPRESQNRFLERLARRDRVTPLAVEYARTNAIVMLGELCGGVFNYLERSGTDGPIERYLRPEAPGR